MKFLIVAAVALLAVVVSAQEEAQLLKSEAQINPDGSYQYAYEIDNSIKAEEQGVLKEIGEEKAVVAQGQFSYKTPEGEEISVVYVADENGFQPQGDHLPVPPPIPALIEKALKYLAEHPPAPEARR